MIHRAISRFILLFFLFESCGNQFKSEPNLVLLDYQFLKYVHEEIREKSPSYLPAYNRLCKEAENALIRNYAFDFHGPNMIINRATRTGEAMEDIGLNESVNWENNNKNQNDHYFLQMTADISTLTLAWFYSKEERYAKKASELIGNWFINTKLNEVSNNTPENTFPFEDQYNGISLFCAGSYIEIIDAITLLERSNAWNKRDTGKIKRWFSDYLQWLLISEKGKHEKGKMNYHGTWFDAQVAAIALYTEREDIAKRAVAYSLTKRISKQFDEKGTQKFELNTDQSYTYSCINLEGHIILGKIAEYVGLDYWSNPSIPAKKVQAAFELVFNFSDKIEEWPYPQSEPVDLNRMEKIIIESEKNFKNPEYKKYLEILKHKIKSNSRLIIQKPIYLDKIN